MQRATIEVTGLVQGVGFRPYVYSLATSLGLHGLVQNRGAHVFVDVEGEPSALDAFIERLSLAPPPGASIDQVRCRRVALAHHRDFAI
ncbi:MAG: acylphosphatase, partial [Acidobacteria bacterium]|nr:acylphosphatase [Acidobacteriota bacterium]